MTVSSFNQINFKDFNPKKDIIWIIVFSMILLGVVFVNMEYERNQLKNYRLTTGKIIEKSGGWKKSAALKVRFTIKGKETVSNFITQSSCFNQYSIGDSVEIKYSISDPKIVEILNCEE